MFKTSVIHIASGDLWAGAENCLRQLISAQVQDPSLDVSAILLNEGRLAQEFRKLGVETTVVDESINSFLQIYLAIRSLVKTKNPSILHTHRRKENILGSLCCIGRSDTVSIRTVHGGRELEAARSKISNIIDMVDDACGRWIQKSVVYVSNELRDREACRYGNNQTTVVENGIDVEGLRAAVKTITKNCNKSRPKTFLFAGRLSSVKRVDLIVEAAKILAEKTLDCRFRIAGSGPLEADIRDLVANYNLDRTVKVLGFRSDILDEIYAADALLITSDHEGLPMVALEAMALETAVVYRPVGALDEVFDHGSCAFRWDPEQCDLATTIRAILDPNSDIKYRTTLALDRVRKKYSTLRMAAGYRKIYRSISEEY